MPVDLILHLIRVPFVAISSTLPRISSANLGALGGWFPNVALLPKLQPLLKLATHSCSVQMNISPQFGRSRLRVL